MDQNIAALVSLLPGYFGWNLARTQCLAGLIIALIKVKTVNFMQLATAKKIWGDRAYSGADLFNRVLTQFECQLEVGRKKKGQRGFHVLPRRWVVERTFAWLSRWRRLSKDYARKPTSSET